jgi:N-acetylmuramoyl-L-alanine amidase
MRALSLLLLAISFLATETRAGWNVVQHDGRRHVPIEDVARFYGLNQRLAGNGAFDLTGGGRTLQGKAGQKEVKIDGVKYVLCFPIAQKDGRTLLSAMDVTKIIEPVLRPGKIPNATQVRTVILDAGHGGHDSGAVGKLGREKEYALDVAVRAKALLESRGYRVLLTRKSDYFIPLEKRSAFANKQQNAIFISIHFNKSKTAAGTGIETFALAPRGVPSMGEEDVTVNAVREYPGHKRDPENILLATAVHSSLLRYCPLPDRGIKRARFHVIRETKIPAILIEGGFLNHPLDARMVASGSYRQRMAMAIAEGVTRFQRAVRGRGFVPPPSAVASGADPTTAPSLRPETNSATAAPEELTVGSRTPIDSTVAQVQIEPTKPSEEKAAQ